MIKTNNTIYTEFYCSMSKEYLGIYENPDTGSEVMVLEHSVLYLKAPKNSLWKPSGRIVESLCCDCQGKISVDAFRLSFGYCRCEKCKKIYEMPPLESAESDDKDNHRDETQPKVYSTDDDEMPPLECEKMQEDG